MFAPAPRSRPWLLLGAFALLGLFALHGLGGHGLHHGAAKASGHDAGMSISGSMDSVGHDSVQADGDGCNGACGSGTASDAREGPGGAIAGWTLALCLGVLVAGVSALLLAGRALRPDVLRVTPGSGLRPRVRPRVTTIHPACSRWLFNAAELPAHRLRSRTGWDIGMPQTTTRTRQDTNR